MHVNDLMRLYLRVVEAAAVGDHTYFNENGYYFAATQECSQVDVARARGRVLHKLGLVDDLEPREVTLEKVDSVANVAEFPKLARCLFVSNSRARAERAERLCGYHGKAPSLMDILEDDIIDALEDQA